jgi:DivIVA domain-containing protein
VVNGDEARNVKFPRTLASAGYDASEVNDLLDRIAAELDAGRPAGPLIANAALRTRFRGYDTGAVDWFLEQLRQEDPSEMARMNANPWRDLAADPYCIRREPGDLAGCVAAPSRQEYAYAWRDFGQRPGTRLSSLRAGAMRRELRTAEQQTVATLRYRLLSETLSASGRTFIWKRVADLADKPAFRERAEPISRDRPGAPVHALERQTDEDYSYLRQLLDETGTPVLYTGGRHFDRRAGAYIKFPGRRWLRFPVRGTRSADAIMTAVDEGGNKIARYRLALNETGWRKIVEITVHPDQQLTGELVLVIALSAPWLRSYLQQSQGGQPVP